jgi:hypothetical protein
MGLLRCGLKVHRISTPESPRRQPSFVSKALHNIQRHVCPCRPRCMQAVARHVEVDGRSTGMKTWETTSTHLAIIIDSVESIDPGHSPIFVGLVSLTQLFEHALQTRGQLLMDPNRPDCLRSIIEVHFIRHRNLDEIPRRSHAAWRSVKFGQTLLIRHRPRMRLRHQHSEVTLHRNDGSRAEETVRLSADSFLDDLDLSLVHRLGGTTFFPLLGSTDTVNL